MSSTNTTKNYFAHGGNELVIGGKLTFLEGATVEGGDGLFDCPGENNKPYLEYQADSSATSVAALREDFNNLLAALRTAGLMKASAPNKIPVQDEGGGT